MIKKNLFGTDGIRATVGDFPLTQADLIHLGRAVGAWAQHTYGHQPTLLLAHDTRVSCSFVKASLITGLLWHPVRVHDAHVLSTPAVRKLVQQLSLDFGIIISASHNPYQDNGIKIIDGKKGKLDYNDECAISDYFFSTYHQSPNFGSHLFMHNADALYQARLTHYFPAQFLAGKKIVIDCAHGAVSSTAPAIFSALGATTIPLHNEPNGTNINEQCGALHTGALQKAVIAHNADVGFAFDGDGDRVIAVNNAGIPKDGDDILALLMQHPTYKDQAIVVGTDMTNQGFAAHIEQQGKQIIRTPVGDKYIAQALEERQLLIGGEQSGHIILRDYLDTGDGIFTALRLCETAFITNNWSLESFYKYPQVLINCAIRHKKDLAQEPIAQIIRESKAQLHSGRVIVRYSGTENVLRIMVEDTQFNHAYAIATHLSQALEKELS